MVAFTTTFTGARADELVELFARPEFVDDFAHELKVEEHQSSVDRHGGVLEHELRLTFSTARIPRPFNRIVPAHVTVDWHTAWTRLPDDTFASRFTATSRAPKAGFTGTSSLRSDGGDTTWALTGQISAERSGLVPARVLETGLARLLTSVLEDQVTVARRWLERS